MSPAPPSTISKVRKKDSVHLLHRKQESTLAMPVALWALYALYNDAVGHGNLFNVCRRGLCTLEGFDQ